MRYTIQLNMKSNFDEESRSIINKALKKQFSPEFLNRIDETILFKTLNKDDILKIIDIEIKYIIELSLIHI